MIPFLFLFQLPYRLFCRYLPLFQCFQHGLALLHLFILPRALFISQLLNNTIELSPDSRIGDAQFLFHFFDITSAPDKRLGKIQLLTGEVIKLIYPGVRQNFSLIVCS